MKPGLALPWPREQALSWGTQAKELGQSPQKQQQIENLCWLYSPAEGGGGGGGVQLACPGLYVLGVGFRPPPPTPFAPKRLFNGLHFPLQRRLLKSRVHLDEEVVVVFWAGWRSSDVMLELSVKSLNRVRKFGVSLRKKNSIIM